VTFTGAGSGFSSVTPGTATSDAAGDAVTTLTAATVSINSVATVKATAVSGGTDSVDVTVTPAAASGTYTTTNSVTGTTSLPVGSWKVTPTVTRQATNPHKGELKYVYLIEAGSLDMREITMTFAKPTSGAIAVTGCANDVELGSNNDMTWDVANTNASNQANTSGWDSLTVTAYFDATNGGTATFVMTSLALKKGTLTPTGPK